MKKSLALIIIMAIMISLVGCGNEAGKKPASSKGEKPSSSEVTGNLTSSEDITSSEDPSESTTPSTDDNTVTDTNININSNTDIDANTNNGSSSDSSDSQKPQKKPMNYDRAWQENPAISCFPIEGELSSEADDMRAAILSHTEQSVKVSGTTYYVSPKGDNYNDGKSPATAFKNLSGVQAKMGEIKSGDAVLFERDGIYRGSLLLNSGVYYGAYGEGARPCIYGSKMNYVNSEWVNEGGNVWRLIASFPEDVGLMVFNHGEAVGYLRGSKSDLKQNYDFYCDRTNGNRVYLYLDKDPVKLFKSIEIGYDCRIFSFDGQSDITIENLTFKYTGGHAVRGSNTKNITVRYCEIGYIGGSYLNGYDDGNVRYGNGIELMNSSRNSLIEHNWIYQIYDSGITHQGDECLVEKFVAKNNLVEFCGMGCIEYWHTKRSDGTVSMKDVTYSGNMLRLAGYGFGGMQRPDKHMSGNIMSNGKPTGASYNYSENFVIENNIFELSTYQLLNLTSAAGSRPILKGNTYIQSATKYLGYYVNVDNKRFDGMVENYIKLDWGDSTADITALK